MRSSNLTQGSVSDYSPTGRRVRKDLAIQNIPIRTETGRLLAKMMRETFGWQTTQDTFDVSDIEDLLETASSKEKNMAVKVSFGDGTDLNTVKTVFDGLRGRNLQLTIGGKEQDVRLLDVVRNPSGAECFEVFFLDGESNRVGNEQFILIESIWEVHVY